MDKSLRQRDELRGIDSSDNSMISETSMSDRDRDKEKERWARMHQTLAEAEQSGNETLCELHKQREQMYRVRDNLQQVNVNLDKSDSLIRTMSRRQFWMKVMTLGLA